MDRSRRIDGHHAVEAGRGDINSVTESDDTGSHDDSGQRDVVRLDVVQERSDGIAVGEVKDPLARGGRCEARQFSRVFRRPDDRGAGVAKGGAEALPDSARRTNNEDGGVGE